MQVSAHRAVVVISGLLTLLVLGGGALAVGFHNGWVRIASQETVTADPQPSAASNESVAPISAEGAAPEPAQPTAEDDAAMHRQKLDEAYRALDDAYAQIRALQSPPPRFASARDDDRRFGEHDGDDDRRERRSGRRDSHDE
jgi:hypothetical protein